MPTKAQLTKTNKGLDLCIDMLNNRIEELQEWKNAHIDYDYILKENERIEELRDNECDRNDKLQADLLAAKTSYENLCEVTTCNDIVDELRKDFENEWNDRMMKQNELKAAEELLKKNAIINMSQDKRIEELEAKLKKKIVQRKQIKTHEEFRIENEKLRAKIEEWKKQASYKTIDLYNCEEHNTWYGTAGTGDNYCEHCDDYVLKDSSSSEED